MPTRRRSPWWVREMHTQELHALGGKLGNDFRSVGLTDRQDWLWSAVISELEYRSRRLPPLRRCTCLLCRAPFPESERDALERLEEL